MSITDTKCCYCDSHLEPPAGFHHLVALNGSVLFPDDYCIRKGNLVFTFRLKGGGSLGDNIAIYTPLGAKFYRVIANVEAWEAGALEEVPDGIKMVSPELMIAEGAS